MSIKALNLIIKKHIKSIDKPDGFFREESVTDAIFNFIEKKRIADLNIEDRYSKKSPEYKSGADMFLEYYDGSVQYFFNVQAKKITPNPDSKKVIVTLHKSKKFKNLVKSISRIQCGTSQDLLKEITKTIFEGKYNQASLQFIESFFWQIEHNISNLTPITIFYISPRYKKLIAPQKLFKDSDHIYAAKSADVYELTNKFSQIRLEKNDLFSQQFSDIIFSVEEFFDSGRQVSFRKILDNQKGSLFPFSETNFNDFIIGKIEALIGDLEKNNYLSYPIEDFSEDEINYLTDLSIFTHNIFLDFTISINQQRLSFHFSKNLMIELIAFLKSNLDSYKDIRNSENVETDHIETLIKISKKQQMRYFTR